MRALVALGFERYNDFPDLRGPNNDIARMREWAEAQGIVVKTFSDAQRGASLITEVADSIEALIVKRPEQIIIYFSGHGYVHKCTEEYWVVPSAPGKTDGVINIQASIMNARTSGIPHIIFVSDACRSNETPTSLRASWGTSLFSATALNGSPNWVDVMNATCPGHEAHSVLSLSGQYDGLFTECLMSAIEGRVPALLYRERDEVVVPVRSTGAYLNQELPKLGRARGLSQQPDCRHECDQSATFARFGNGISNANN